MTSKFSSTPATPETPATSATTVIPTTTAPPTTVLPAAPVETRAAKTHRTRVTRRSAAALAVLSIGAMAGTGFVLEPAMAAQNDRAAETAALSASTGLHSEQLDAYSTVADAHAEKAATGTLAAASAVITAAENKVDATPLVTPVAMLSNYEYLAPERIYELVDLTNAQVEPVQAATAEADRVAAEQAAAQEAAAAAAAATAAQEAAAAQAAAEAEAAQAAKSAKAAPKASSAPAPSAPSNPSGAQAVARDMMAAKYGWGADQFGCLVSLWDKESGWNVNAYNASSGATGIPQALPGSKMATAGSDWATNASTQISWGLGYISGSYGTPCAAWAKSESVGWY